jgi:hypothetical protein
MASALTTSETVEWEGLLARNTRGKVEPGSPEARRLQALTEAATGNRALLDAKEPSRAMTREEAMEFYGIKRRCYYELMELGRRAADPVPWGEPAAMTDWFARMSVLGRKHAPPGLITRRAEEARLGLSRPAPEAPAATPPAAEPMVLGDAATTDEIMVRYQRIAGALGRKYEEAAAAGNLELARTYRAEMDTVTDRIRQWAMNAAKLREAQQWVRPSDFAATVRDCALRLWKILRVEIQRDLPPAAVDAALDRLVSQLPELLPNELRACLAPAP